MSVHALENVVQNYAWGHPTRMAELQGRRPGSEPEAELWLGTHPSAPSRVVTGDGTVELSDLLAGEGAGLVPGGGSELPFLLKILTIGGPLSIQVHPNPEQARAGFDAAEAAGLALDDPTRSYKDRSDKPEVVVALEPMRVLVGVLDAEQRRNLVQAGLTWLTPFEDATPAELVTGVFGMSEVDAASALASLVVADLPQDRADLVAELLEQYPGDRGVLVATCMNLVHLQPGQALFTDAGMLHAYVSGTAVEIMNPSDNVLRAGLTPKHVDVDELARILVDDQTAPAPIEVESLASGGERIPLWTDAATLRRYRGEGAGIDLHGVTLVLATEGAVRLTIDGEVHEISSGHAVVVLGDHEASICGGEVYLAACGQAPRA